MVPNTSLVEVTSLCLPLSLLYPSHPRAFPNHHSFPSNSPPPQAFLSPQTKLPNRRDNEWESLRWAFFVQFFYVFIGCNDFTLDPNNFFQTKTWKSIISLIIIFITDKKCVFVPFLFCHCHFNLTAHIFHQPQHSFFWLNALSHLYALRLGFRP